ncbi:MAG TPA: type II toxin-antitoxin system VapC family toxin [Verrucomicrobiae bacterium]|nr:type II toxin-antitoxin system VapC family toxin [Verrucomicrobiae bacterium]
MDTHIWIWAHLEPWNISSEVTNELASPRNELWLSPLSIWELVLLVEKKRLDLNADMSEWVQQSMKDLDLQEAPFTSALAHELQSTLLGYADPGDRFLVATAKAYDLTLVTADQRLLQIPGLPILANR